MTRSRPDSPYRLIAREQAGQEGIAEREARTAAEQRLRSFYSRKAAAQLASNDRDSAARILADAEALVVKRRHALDHYKASPGKDAAASEVINLTVSIDLALEWIATCKRDLAHADQRVAEAAEALAVATAAMETAA